MATLKPVIVPAKALKDNKHKVRISVAHNGSVRYILTDIIVDSEKQFKDGQVVKRPDASILNTRLRGLIQKYQTAIDEMEYTAGLTCSELVYLMKDVGRSKHRTLLSIYEEYVESANVSESSRLFYINMYNRITECVGGDMLIESVRHSTIVSLDKHLRDRGLKPSSIFNVMAFFSSLLNFAKRSGYVQYKIDPFLGYKKPRPEIRQSWLSVDEVRRIRDIVSTKKNIIKCRDIFMLSYYLGGINVTDLLDIDFSACSQTLRYVRKKTANQPKINKYVEFDIPDEAKEIIGRYIGKDGRLSVTDYDRRDKFNAFFLNNMPKLAEQAGLDKLIYYSARKSFAQHALTIGVKEGVIDYILGHSLGGGGNRMLYHYVYVTPEMATEAVRKVLDNLK